MPGQGVKAQGVGGTVLMDAGVTQGDGRVWGAEDALSQVPSVC